jgi:hypothetical protein
MAQDPIKLALKLAQEPLKKKKRKHFEEGGPDHESETKDTETKDTETKDTSDTDQKGFSVERGPQEEKPSEQTKEENQPSMVDRALGLASNAASAIGNFVVSPAEAATPAFNPDTQLTPQDLIVQPSPNQTLVRDPATGELSVANPTQATGMSNELLDAANAQYVEKQQLQDAIKAQADAAENAAMNANNALLMRAGPVTGLGDTPSVTSPDQRLLDAALSRAGTITGGDSGTALNAALSRTGPLTGGDSGTALNAALSRTGPFTGGYTGTSTDAALSRTGPFTGGTSGTSTDAALSRTGPLTGGNTGTSTDAALSRTGPLTGVDGETALNSGDDTVTRLIAALYRTGPMTGDTSGMPSTPYSAVRAYRDAITPNLGVESSDAALNAALSRTGPMTGDTTGMPSTPYSAVRAYRDAITPSLGAGPSDAALRLARDTITQNLGGTGGEAAVTGGGGTAQAMPTAGNVPTPPIPLRDLQGPDIAEKIAGLFGLSTQQQLDKFYKQYTDQGLSDIDAYNKAISDIQTMRANAKPGPFDKHGYVAPDIVAPQAPVSPTDTTPAIANTAFKLPGVNQPYVPPNAQASSTGTGYADLGANASALRQAQYAQAIKNALLLANGNQYYG